MNRYTVHLLLTAPRQREKEETTCHDAILGTLQLNMVATQKPVIPVEVQPRSGVNSRGDDDS